MAKIKIKKPKHGVHLIPYSMSKEAHKYLGRKEPKRTIPHQSWTGSKREGETKRFLSQKYSKHQKHIKQLDSGKVGFTQNKIMLNLKKWPALFSFTQFTVFSLKHMKNRAPIYLLLFALLGVLFYIPLIADGVIAHLATTLFVGLLVTFSTLLVAAYSSNISQVEGLNRRNLRQSLEKILTKITTDNSESLSYLGGAIDELKKDLEDTKRKAFLNSNELGALAQNEIQLHKLTLKLSGQIEQAAALQKIIEKSSRRVESETRTIISKLEADLKSTKSKVNKSTKRLNSLDKLSSAKK